MIAEELFYKNRLEECKNHPSELTFLLEEIGRDLNTPWAIETLLSYLDNTNHYIVEGALYGLENHQHLPEVRSRLKDIIALHPLPVIRDIANDILK